MGRLKMNLINFREFPPGGYIFFQPEIGWRNPDPMLPINMVAEQLSIARYQNPAAGLDPSMEACIEAIGAFTCQRFAQKPSVFDRYCTSDESLARQVANNARPTNECKGCGKR